MTDKNDDTNNEQTAKLTAQVAKLETELEKVRNSAARYRVARNQALREREAQGRVLSAHKVAFDVAKADLDGLSIGEGGTVEGEFTYEPPSPTQGNKTTEPPGEAATGLSAEAIDRMSPQEVADNWDKVMGFHNSQYKHVPGAV